VSEGRLRGKMSIPARAEAGHCHRQEWAKEKETCHPTCPCGGRQCLHRCRSMPVAANASTQTRRRKSKRLHDRRQLPPPNLTLGYLCLGPAAPFPCGSYRLSRWHLNLNLLLASCETKFGKADFNIEGWEQAKKTKEGVPKRALHATEVGASCEVCCFDVGIFCEVVGCRSSGTNGRISSEATNAREQMIF